MRDRIRIPSLPTERYPSLGRCIYCGRSDRKLTDEHIIPFALCGNHVISKGSCEECAKETSKFERIVCKNMFDPFRADVGLPTRRPDKRPDNFDLRTLGHDGRVTTRAVHVDEHSATLPIFVVFGSPASLPECRILRTYGGMCPWHPMQSW